MRVKALCNVRGWHELNCCTGWPLPPSREPWCHSCPAGWASTQPDQTFCSMCTPGSFAQYPRSPSCQACPNGTYANSWGSSHCNHCIIGTFAPHMVSQHLTSTQGLRLLEPSMCFQAFWTARCGEPGSRVREHVNLQTWGLP